MGLKKPAVGGKRFAYGTAAPSKHPAGYSGHYIVVRGLSFRPSVVAAGYVGANYPNYGHVGIKNNIFKPELKGDINFNTNYTDDLTSISKADFYDDGFALCSENATLSWIAYE